jgi:hypothetical protein
MLMQSLIYFPTQIPPAGRFKFYEYLSLFVAQLHPRKVLDGFFMPHDNTNHAKNPFLPILPMKNL